MNWILVYHLTVTAFLLLVTVNIFINWFVFIAPRPRRFDTTETSMPLVSVLVPARNEAKRITPCLRSLLAQDYPNYELVILDDHSEDDTAEVVLGHGFSRDKTSRLRLVEVNRCLPAGPAKRGPANNSPRRHGEIISCSPMPTPRMIRRRSARWWATHATRGRHFCPRGRGRSREPGANMR